MVSLPSQRWKPVLQEQPDAVVLLTHPDGIQLPPPAEKAFGARIEHDPADLSAGRDHAVREGIVPIGLFYRNPDAVVYDDFTTRGLEADTPEKVRAALRES